MCYKDNDLEIEDIKKVINGLMQFIINDSRQYVDSNKQHQYIKKYLELLEAIIKCKELPCNENLIENIIKDIDSVKNT